MHRLGFGCGKLTEKGDSWGGVLDSLGDCDLKTKVFKLPKGRRLALRCCTQNPIGLDGLPPN